MKTTVLVFHDGRRNGYLQRTLESFAYYAVVPGIHKMLIVDDAENRISQDYAFLDSIAEKYSALLLLNQTNLGIFGTVRAAWQWLLENDDCDYVIHHENDFIYNGKFDFGGLQTLLDKYPDICQVVLKRQPWSKKEKARGSILDKSYCEEITLDGLKMVKQQRWFSFNPCMYRKTDIVISEKPLTEKQIMTCHRKQGRYSLYWGGWDSKPIIEHIGY